MPTAAPTDDAERGGRERHPDDAAPAPEQPREHVVTEVVGAEREVAATAPGAGCRRARVGSCGARSGPTSATEDDRSRVSTMPMRVRPRAQRRARSSASAGAAGAAAEAAASLASSPEPRPQPRRGVDREHVGEQVEDARSSRRRAARSPGRPAGRGSARRAASALPRPGIGEQVLDRDDAAGEVDQRRAPSPG